MDHNRGAAEIDHFDEKSVIWRFASEKAHEAVAARDDFLATLREHAGSMIDEDAARVIFSELVANVVRHAPGPIAIALALEGSTATLTVIDSGPGFVFKPVLPRNLYCESARGLFIVSRYARDVRVSFREGAGTSVSATLPVASQGTEQSNIIEPLPDP